MGKHAITQSIIDKTRQALADGHEPLVVLDLDGTLYDNRPRTLRIIQEYAHEHAVDLPDLVSQVSAACANDLVYKVADSLSGMGIHDPALHKAIVAYWFDRFFTDAYVTYDLPTPGAVEFVKALQQAGAVPTYLTGRDAPNMLQGTIAALQRDGFPVGTVDTRVILKDDFETPDEPYKRSVVKHLRYSGRVVGVFDNEPGLCNLFHDAFPDATTVWLDTSHAPGAPPLAAGLLSVKDFCPLV